MVGMASALKPTGSTAAWRRIRIAILRRDGYRCQMMHGDGRICGQPATDVDHIVRREHGGTDAPGNLRAACTRCNRGWRRTQRSVTRTVP